MSDQVAANIKIATDSLDSFSKVFELGSGLSDVSEILRISRSLVSSFTVVAAILTLSLIGNRPSNGQHQEILRRFNQWSNQVNVVRDDIHVRNLGDDLGWQLTAHYYMDAVNHIESGIMEWLRIGRATDEAEWLTAKIRLNNHCISGACISNLNKLIEGLTGRGILDSFDRARAHGHRKRISHLGTRLLQVACGGIMVLATYETMQRGEKGAKQFMERRGYANQLEEACRETQSVLDRCARNFKENMLVDINPFLDKGGSNQNLANEIGEFMSDKYDWLENFVLVYDDIWGDKNHDHVGQFVDSLHRNGKCGVVFYRTKGETPKFSHRYSEVYDAVDMLSCSKARDCKTDIQNLMAQKGVGYIGCAAIRREPLSGFLDNKKGPDPNICWKSTFSTEAVVVVGKKSRVINSFSYKSVFGTWSLGVTKIVLLQ